MTVRRSSGTLLLLALFATATLAYVHRLIINALIDPIAADLELTDAQSSLLQGPAFAIVYAVLVIPMGMLADRFNRLRLLRMSVFVWCCGILACGLAPSFAALFVGYMAVGLGQAALVPCVVSLVSDSYVQARRGMAMGVFMTGVNTGFSIAYAIGGTLLDAARDGAFQAVPALGVLAPWRQVFVLSSLPGALLLLLIARLGEPARPAAMNVTGALGPMRALLTARPFAFIFLLLGIHVALLAIADNGLYAWLPRLLSRNYGLSATELGLMVGAIVGVAGVIGGPVGGLMTDWTVKRYGTAGAAVMVLLTSAFLTMVIPFYAVHSVAASYAATAAWIVAIVVNSTATYTLISLAAPAQAQGVASSLLVSINAFFGLGIGPVAIALAVDGWLYSPLAINAAIVAVGVPVCVGATALAVMILRLTSAAVRPETSLP